MTTHPDVQSKAASARAINPPRRIVLNIFVSTNPSHCSKPRVADGGCRHRALTGPARLPSATAACAQHHRSLPLRVLPIRCRTPTPNGDYRRYHNDSFGRHWTPGGAVARGVNRLSLLPKRRTKCDGSHRKIFVQPAKNKG